MTATVTETAVAAAPENRTFSDEIRDYTDRVRGGDVGSLPAILGLIVLVAFFSIAQPDAFTSNRNFASLLVQSAPVTFIAMGLVFVLLLGEIDLAAGFTSGTAAAILAVLLAPKHGFSWPVAVLACVGSGIVIGLAMGLLVAKLRIPSFVVTLAAFLGLQGVLMLVIGEGGTIGVDNETVLSVMNNNMTPLWGWVLLALIVVGYAGITLIGLAGRRRAGLATASPVTVAIKIGGLALLLGVVTFMLNQERANNPAIKSIKGIPVIVPFTLVFLLLLTFLLSRTAFGRHVYAVGGNVEAARRAGINVAWIRITCFIIGSTLAAVAGILFASYSNSVSPSTGGSQTLLYAVGAAVIGGTSLFGGKGRLIDAILGGLVVAVINNGLQLITEKAAVQYIVTGLVLLLAASVDAVSRRRAADSGT